MSLFSLLFLKTELPTYIFNLKLVLYTCIISSSLPCGQICIFKPFKTFPCSTHKLHMKWLTKDWWAVFMIGLRLKINVRFIIVFNTKRCTLLSLISVLWLLQRNKTLSYLFQHLLQKTSIMHKNIWKYGNFSYQR